MPSIISSSHFILFHDNPAAIPNVTNAKNVEEVRAGNAKAFNALVGQAMKASKGKANPAQVNDLLRKKLA